MRELPVFKARCSQLATIMTPLVGGITDKQREQLDIYIKREADFKAGVDKAKDLTPNMREDMNALIEKRDTPPRLPDGVISYLKRWYSNVMYNDYQEEWSKYTQKGIMMEDAAIAMVAGMIGVSGFKCENFMGVIEASSIDVFKEEVEWRLHEKLVSITPHGECGGDYSAEFEWDGDIYKCTYSPDWNRHDKRFYYIDNWGSDHTTVVKLGKASDRLKLVKNEEFFENEWICGTPDIILDDQIRDTKCPWDSVTFGDAVDNELSSLYWWQMQGYQWLCDKPIAHVDFCLVNTPAELTANKKEVCYDDIPVEYRYHSKMVTRDESVPQRVEERVKMCREWLQTYHILRELKVGGKNG